MKLDVISEDKKANKLLFTLGGVTPSYVNALRRVMISEVPTMAIEDIEIRKNSSILYDEIMALRLGLIPLTTDLKSYNVTQECKCEGKGCARCTLILTLKEKGPKTVYSGDMKTKDPKVKPVFDNIPIVKLLKGQELELEATAMMGIGKAHQKWSPGLVFYTQKPVITIGKVDNAKEIAEKYPDLFELKGGKLVANENASVDKFAAVADEIPTMKIDQKEDEFNFTIESWGQLAPKEMLLKALDVFDAQLDRFADGLKTL